MFTTLLAIVLLAYVKATADFCAGVPNCAVTMPRDIVFLLDISGSMSQSIVDNQAMQYMKQMFCYFDEDAESQVGLAVFSGFSLEEIIPLAHYDKSTWSGLLDTAKSNNKFVTEGYTPTAEGLKLAESMMLADGNPSHQQIIFVITDGEPNPIFLWQSGSSNNYALTGSLPYGEKALPIVCQGGDSALCSSSYNIGNYLSTALVGAAQSIRANDIRLTAIAVAAEDGSLPDMSAFDGTSNYPYSVDAQGNTLCGEEGRYCYEEFESCQCIDTFEALVSGPVSQNVLYGPNDWDVAELITISSDALCRTDAPTKNPTVSPTKNPTMSPTVPTNSPTTSPTKNPTVQPTKNPTIEPTKNPTVQPTKNPTEHPTKNPTKNPTEHPTKNPTQNPTIEPTAIPSRSPTYEGQTAIPTRSPTTFPTETPTNSPSVSPTKNPTANPTENPTKNPTTSPTTSPTSSPTVSPTKNPTEHPTKNPTGHPTKNPTKNPTEHPTKNPTTNPTEHPTKNPTENPTKNPTKNPTEHPTKNPTNNPTENPTEFPTRSPTTSPTELCTHVGDNPWSLGYFLNCCEGQGTEVCFVENNSVWQFQCVPGGTCTGTTPVTTPTTSAGTCSAVGVDPYCTSTFIECCAGSEVCTQNWDGDGRFYGKCMPTGTCGVDTTIETPEDAPCAKDYEDPWQFGYEQECCSTDELCLSDWNNECRWFFKCVPSGECGRRRILDYVEHSSINEARAQCKEGEGEDNLRLKTSAGTMPTVTFALLLLSFMAVL